MTLKIQAMCLWLLSSQALYAQSVDIPNPESIAVDGQEILVLSTGVDADFGNPAQDGAIYRMGADNSPAPVHLSDAVGLRNPTAIVTFDDRWIIADGAEIVAVDHSGQLLWRSTAAHENAFLYDLATMPNGMVMISDFGTGRLFELDPKTGAMTEFAFDTPIPGLARLAVLDDRIFLTTWGGGEDFSGSVQVLSKDQDIWQLASVAGGFGNPEGLAVLDGETLLVGTWRGRPDQLDARVFRLTLDGTTTSLATFDGTVGPADLMVTEDALIVPLLSSNKVLTVPIGNLN